MTPMSSSLDKTDGCLTYSVITSDHVLNSWVGSNGDNLCGSKFCRAIFLAFGDGLRTQSSMMTRAARNSPFPGHVVHVVLTGPEPEVRRIHACWNIAFVADVHVFRDWPKNIGPHISGRKAMFLASENSLLPKNFPGPQPAAGIRFWRHLRPESIRPVDVHEKLQVVARRGPSTWRATEAVHLHPDEQSDAIMAGMTVLQFLPLPEDTHVEHP